MISAKDNILVRPWLDRKYHYHRQKILSATPAIDTKSPPQRAHVQTKWKKLQNEQERTKKIEKDNLILMQRLNYIMTNHWLDNYLSPQPTFLHRLPMYGAKISIKDPGIVIPHVRTGSRREKCVACTPEQQIRSRSAPPLKKTGLPNIVKKPATAYPGKPGNIIQVSRGSLKLTVKYPTDSVVKVEGQTFGRKNCCCALKS